MAVKRNNTIQNSYRGSSYYTYGNVAFDVQPEYTPYYIDEEAKKKRIAEEKLQKAEIRESRVTALKLIAIIVVLFAGSIAFMGMHVKVAQENFALREQKSQLADLQASNNILEAELTEQIDLDYIKEQAATRLGMAEPQPYQIVYIDVPKQSYTIQYAADTTDEEKNTGFLKFKNWLKKD
ncbi:cell division protein FtsL [Anaerotignum neopropionicum]|uniref:Cell division protein FtsL n=1 Tax=Anaerotignum neopropionicum TaxID=36847 RepID=A0A136WFV7_9FIRM|nr:hypothetical protein [Anaerotignum neopropionicum]KXL53347.1 cell division protein FtsL [Anaerotignum neopropionicum]